MQKCCFDCCKFIVFFFNFLALLAVGAVLGGAIYVLKESKSVLGFTIEPSLSEDNEKNAILFSLFLIVIVVFAFLTIFTFLGCCGSAWESSCMIGSFVIILFIFLGANVGGIVFMYFHYHDEVDLASDELGKWIGYYDPSDLTSVNRFLWDTMQSTFGCCGADGQDDWSAAKELPNGEKVPISCCKDPNDCNVYSPTASEIWMEGCVPKLELYYRIAFWALPSVMAFMLLAALIVCSGQKSREQRHAKNRSSRHSGDYSEETGYVYRASATPDYPTAPPYNPEYPAHQNPYAEQYPTGVIPPNAEYRQPLIQPPPYHDVIAARR